MPFLATLGSGSFNSYRGVRGIARRVISLVLDSNTSSYDVYTNRGPSYVAGLSDITVTVNPGVTVGSLVGPGNYSLLVPSAFDPNDTVTIINNGSIIGAGGTGGAGGSIQNGPTASGPGLTFTEATIGVAGANGVYVNRPTVITNNGTIAGGGGGGGGGAWNRTDSPAPKPSIYFGAGGGGGGGVGAPPSFGQGGAAGTYTAVPPLISLGPSGFGASGFSGSAASPGPNTGGAGGAGSTNPPSRPPTQFLGGPGGNGGALGANGSAGTGPNYGPFYPPTWFRSSGTVGSGGSAGFYIVGNPFVTWPATGTRLGSVG